MSEIVNVADKTKINRKQAGSNWESFIQQISINSPKSSKNIKNPLIEQGVQGNRKKHTTNNKNDKNSKYSLVGMDCEMVGTGLNGEDNMLARVSVVNQKGDVLLDKYVKPREKVTDYRTSVSGIRPSDIENGEDFDKVQDEVVNLLQNKILVGHSIHNDLGVLYIKHPFKLIRDTAKYRPLAKLVSNGSTPSLKRLTKAILGVDIQDGEHNSIEDARAAMQIYNRVSADWEKHVKKNSHKFQNRHGNRKS